MEESQVLVIKLTYDQLNQLYKDIGCTYIRGKYVETEQTVEVDSFDEEGNPIVVEEIKTIRTVTGDVCPKGVGMQDGLYVLGIEKLKRHFPSEIDNPEVYALIAEVGEEEYVPIINDI
jgi:hypothetical protein